MADLLKFSAGTLVEFSKGAYSDYTTCGLMVTLVDCDLAALAKAYRDDFKPKQEWDEPDHYGFMGWLVAQQHCAPVSHQSVHLGDYGDWDI